MACREVYYRVKNFKSVWRNEELNTTEFASGGLFSCLKLSGDFLFTGMITGDIRQFCLHQTNKAKHSESGRIFQVGSPVLTNNGSVIAGL